MKEKRTYADRAENIKQAVTKRRRRIRQLAVEHKGGQCQLCGYRRFIGSLDLHHLDAKMKDFAISAGGVTRSWKRVRAEIEKCILLCANCHREVHGGITQLPTATSVE